MANKTSKKTMRTPGNRSAIIGITVVVMALALVVFVRVRALKQKDAEYQKKEAAYEQLIKEEKERSEELEENRIFVQTKQYIEKIAREKLGLVNPDEIIIKPNN